MTEARLASSVQVSAFIRLAEIQGDFATVLRKGDPVAGAILLIAVIRGKNPVCYERFPSLEGDSRWQTLAPLETENDDAAITERWKKRAMRDPDLWVLELDVASSERLTRLIDASS